MFNIAIFSSLLLSVITLGSVSPDLFPSYFIYIIIGLILYWFFSKLGFDVIRYFSTHIYVISIILLLTTLIIGQVTRGTVRWIPIGSFTFQPAEFIRPFLIVFFAQYLTRIGELKFKRLLTALLLLVLPVSLILIQPSLGVSILTIVGFVGVLFSSDFNKKYILVGLAIISALMPIFWFVLQPYQKSRVETFLNPQNDPLGAGYNSIQSVISVGSGRLFGKGLGKGVQTQLAFLPEKQTDFIFASISEELGFVGASILLILTFIIFISLIKFMENAVSVEARAFLSGFFLMYFVQVFVHIGMNMGIMPVTGLPYPLISSGGSSLIATLIGLGIARGSVKR